MTKTSATQIAARAAEAAGYDLSQFKKPEVSFFSASTNTFSQSTNAQWSVFFDNKRPERKSFWVNVDDASGATAITPCR